MEEITNLIENLKSKNRHFVNLLYTSIIRHGFDNTGLTKSKMCLVMYYCIFSL